MAITRRVRSRGKKYALSKRQARAVAKIASKQINKRAETKHHLTENSYAVSSAGSSMIHLTGVPQGDTSITRDGEEIYIRSVQARYQMTNGDENNEFRIIVFQWFDDGLPTLDDILQGGAGTSYPYLAPYSEDSLDKRRILYDRVHTMDNNYSGGVKSGYGKFMITKIPRRKMEFDGSATSTPMNGIYVVAVSDSAAAPHVTLRLFTKLRFLDM